MNQEEILKDSIRTLEGSYRTTRKGVNLLDKTGKIVQKPVKKVYSVAVDAVSLTGEAMFKLFKQVLGKDIELDSDGRKLKSLYKKGIPLSSSDCDINDLKLFQKIMKHHEVDYSIKKDCSIDGRFNIFFLARDAELIEKALERFIRSDRFKDFDDFQKNDFDLELPNDLDQVKASIDKLESQIQNDKNPKDKIRHQETLKIYQQHFENQSQDKSKKTEKVMPPNHENDKKSTLEKLEKAKEKANLSNKNKEKVKEKKQELSR